LLSERQTGPTTLVMDPSRRGCVSSRPEASTSTRNRPCGGGAGRRAPKIPNSPLLPEPAEDAGPRNTSEAFGLKPLN
jgi:hypothetical protein